MFNKGNMTPVLTKEQCSILRGFAILSIVLHNIAHTFAFAVKENEYTFSLGRTNLLSEYIHDLPFSSPIQLLAFFGHYGVPIFVFLSGFGLVMKYEKSGTKVSASAFFWYNYLKLFRLLIVGYMLYLIFSPVDLSGKSTVFMLTMTINIIPNIEIVPGPYWFFGLMLQLYIFYRLIIYNASGDGKRLWIVPVCVIVVAYLSQAFLSPISPVLSKMRYNIFSGLMPFATGVLVARFCTIRSLSTMTLLIMIFVSLVLVWLCNYNLQAWLWSWVPAVVGSVAFVLLVSKAGKAMILLKNCLVWTGLVSAVIFIVHPIVRIFAYEFIDYTKIFPYPTMWAYMAMILYLFFTLILSAMLAKLIKFIPSPLLKTNV